MKRTVLAVAMAVTGCNPMPYKQSCRIPDFTTAQGLKVKDTLPRGVISANAAPNQSRNVLWSRGAPPPWKYSFKGSGFG